MRVCRIGCLWVSGMLHSLVALGISVFIHIGRKKGSESYEEK